MPQWVLQGMVLAYRGYSEPAVENEFNLAAERIHMPVEACGVTIWQDGSFWISLMTILGHSLP